MNADYCQRARSGESGTQTATGISSHEGQYNHVVPFTLDGDTEVDNLVVSWVPCDFDRLEPSVE